MTSGLTFPPSGEGIKAYLGGYLLRLGYLRKSHGERSEEEFFFIINVIRLFVDLTKAQP